MRLHDLRPAEGSRKERTRVGRGIAAGKGKTAGRGTKGQKARAGGSIPAWFEGGQTPLHQRIPKLRGFKNRFKIEYEIVNVGAIAAAAERGAFEAEAADAKPTAKTKAAAQITVNQDILRAVGLVRSLDKPLKILGDGELSTPLFVVADAFTASARAKIEAAGGTVNVLEVPTKPLKAIGLEPGEERTAPKQSRGAQEATAKEARARTRASETAEAAEVEAAAPKKPRAKAERGRGRGRRRRHRRRRPSRPRRRRDTGRDGRAGRSRGRAGRERRGRRGPERRPPKPKPDAREATASRGRRRAADRRDRARQRRRQRGHRRGRDRVRRRRLTRVRIPPERLPGAGYPAPDPGRPWPAHRLPVPGRRAGAGHQSRRARQLPRGQPALRAAEPVLRRRPVELLGRGAGPEPLHQRLDHHAADAGRRALAPGAQP